MSENRVETFADARAALDFMSRELSQAITTAQIPFLAQEENPSSPYQLGTLTPLVYLYFGNVAFIASVGNGASDGMDLTEVVYRLSRPSATHGIELSHSGLGTPVIPSVFVDPLPGPYKLVRRVSPYAPATANYWNYGTQSAGGVPWDFYGVPPPPPATWPETSWLNGTQVLAENVVSLRFAFVDDQNSPTTYYHWNSTTTPNAWGNELNTSVQAALGGMPNRAPSQVQISLTVLDSRAAARYSAATDLNAKQRIYLASQHTFYTSVYIPNRQP
jgi:hypothetical protein